VGLFRQLPKHSRKRTGVTVTTRDDAIHMNVSTKNLLRHLTPERGFDLIRIYLGVGLFVRGVLFLMDPTWIGHMLESSGSATVLAPRLIAIGHMAGGALLGVGLFTRLAAAIQILPVLGAVVLLHLRDDLAGENQSLEFSLLVLVMLAFFAVFGAGQWSLDAQRRVHQQRRAPRTART
jgi:putative oxidoreductase